MLVQRQYRNNGKPTTSANSLNVCMNNEGLHLKEQCHDIFRVRFFYQTTSPGSNRQAQERFRIFYNIRGVIRIRSRLTGDEYTGELIRIP
jgi:hypothetical protein